MDGGRFRGVIGTTVHESMPSWDEPPLPPMARHVVVVVLGDTGFAHLGCYGSPIATPFIDGLARAARDVEEGLRLRGRGGVGRLVVVRASGWM